MSMKARMSLGQGLFLFGLGAVCAGLTFLAEQEVKGQKPGVISPVSRRTDTSSSSPDTYLRQSPGAVAAENLANDYGLGSSHASKLKPYPQPCLEGMRTPFDLWLYAGKGKSSWGSPQLRMSFSEWMELHRVQKPKLMADVREYMASRYDFSGKTIPRRSDVGGTQGSSGRTGRTPAPGRRLL